MKALNHKGMVEYHAENHDLIDGDNFSTKENYVSHLMHLIAYEKASAIHTGGEILDLGCNTGYGSKVLSVYGKVSAVDVSEKAISTAKEQHASAGIDFQVIDGERLPFENGRFRLIVSFQVIEHIVDYQKYLGEIKRVLSPGGIALFTTPNAKLRLDEGMKPWNPFHVREFDASNLKSLLDSSFKHVTVLGLFAEESIYSIEAARLKRNRENARKEAELMVRLKNNIKKIVPEGILSLLRSIRDSKVDNNEKESFDMDFIKKHGTSSFFYKQTDNANSLDLLALCSDDEDAIKKSLIFCHSGK